MFSFFFFWGGGEEEAGGILPQAGLDSIPLPPSPQKNKNKDKVVKKHHNHSECTLFGVASSSLREISLSLSR